MLNQFNFFDFVFIAFALIFVALACLRGFIKEIFALLNWVISLTVSYYASPYLAKLLSSYSDNKYLLEISSRIILFILTFIVTFFSTSSLRDALQEKAPKAFDRSLGILYGLLKTLLIFGFVYSMAEKIHSHLDQESEGKLPLWLAESKSSNILQIPGKMLDPITNAIIKIFDNGLNGKAKDDKKLDEKIDEVVEEYNSGQAVDANGDKAKKVKKENKKNKKDVKDDSPDAGYNTKDIEKMNRLIEIIDK